VFWLKLDDALRILPIISHGTLPALSECWSGVNIERIECVALSDYLCQIHKYEIILCRVQMAVYPQFDLVAIEKIPNRRNSLRNLDVNTLVCDRRTGSISNEDLHALACHIIDCEVNESRPGRIYAIVGRRGESEGSAVR